VYVLASSADTILFAVSAMVGVAGALGVAYTVFRSSGEQRLREVDQHVINNQTILLSQQDKELERLRNELAANHQLFKQIEERFTQRAAVDRLADEIKKEETARRIEHLAMQDLFEEKIEVMYRLLKDVIAVLRGKKGTLE
jgi:predicted methyltransferase